MRRIYRVENEASGDLESGRSNQSTKMKILPGSAGSKYSVRDAAGVIVPGKENKKVEPAKYAARDEKIPLRKPLTKRQT